METMKNSKVLSLAGGGGPLLGIVSETLSTPCHPELDSGSIQRDRKDVTLVRFRLGGRNDTHGHAAFTMAEILLSLTIIGVVAAITLPSLTGNINERTWNTQRKALYARMSQAVALMPSLNGYGKLSAETDSESAIDTAGESFLTEGLSKVLKINNICDSDHLADCGIPKKIIPMGGSSTISLDEIKTVYGLHETFSTYLSLDTKAAAFETPNGESILTYYNPKCPLPKVGTGSFYAQSMLCVNFIYDLNGNKGPNTVGKDIGFITVHYPIDPLVVAPMPISKTPWVKQTEAGAACKKLDSETRPANREELMSIFYNTKLVLPSNSDPYTWSTTIDGTNAWRVVFNSGYTYLYQRNTGATIRCIK